jgi:hypothetical protein
MSRTPQNERASQIMQSISVNRATMGGVLESKRGHQDHALVSPQQPAHVTRERTKQFVRCLLEWLTCPVKLQRLEQFCLLFLRPDDEHVCVCVCVFDIMKEFVGERVRV